MRAASIWLVVFFASLLRTSAAQPETGCGRPCREHPHLSGACFTIRGRMTYHNGAPSVRIWRVGTKRILGVSEQRFHVDGYCDLPTSIRERLSWESDLFAEFVVCPFTPEAPGVMQLVCVDSAAHLRVEPRKPDQAAQQ